MFRHERLRKTFTVPTKKVCKRRSGHEWTQSLLVSLKVFHFHAYCLTPELLSRSSAVNCHALQWSLCLCLYCAEKLTRQTRVSHCTNMLMTLSIALVRFFNDNAMLLFKGYFVPQTNSALYHQTKVFCTFKQWCFEPPKRRCFPPPVNGVLYHQTMMFCTAKKWRFVPPVNGVMYTTKQCCFVPPTNDVLYRQTMVFCTAKQR